MKYPKYKFLIKNLLSKGYYTVVQPIKITDIVVDESIEIFNEVAKYDGLYLLNELFVHQKSPLCILGLAALLSSSTDELLERDDIRMTIFEILLDKLPEELLECIEIIQSGTFLRKLGSRSQKLFRKVLEAWSYEELSKYIKESPNEIKQLCLKIHPRYKDKRGQLIKKMLHF